MGTAGPGRLIVFPLGRDGWPLEWPRRPPWHVAGIGKDHPRAKAHTPRALYTTDSQRSLGGCERLPGWPTKTTDMRGSLAPSYLEPR